MQEAILQHLAKLVSFQTTSDKPDEILKCLQYIQDELAFYPFEVRDYPVSYQDKDTGAMKQTVSRLWLTEPTLHPRIILYCHIDVVPAPPELFEMKIDGDTAAGRGTFDMKFAAAVYIEVLKKLVQEGKKLPSLAVWITSDEEIGGLNGTRYLLQDVGYRGDVVIMPDGGNGGKIVKEAKGAIYSRISTTGQTSHGSRPWQGKSAIDLLLRIATAIRNLYPQPVSAAEGWTTTVNMSRISGGQHTALNQLADEASLYMDIRYVFGDNPIPLLETIVKRFTDARLDIILHKDAFFLPENSPYVQRWEQLLSQYFEGEIYIKEDGTADHHYFSSLSIPTIVSQGKGGYIHTEKEEINIPSLMYFAHVLYEFLAGS
jgi:succinyl-diaminopimelate desuccinylase